MNAETLDKLYLEWSQFTKATTAKELALEERLIAAIKQIELMRQALKPFAEYSKHYPRERTYGNRPTDGVIMSVASHNVGEADITVEDLHRAASFCRDATK